MSLLKRPFGNRMPGTIPGQDYTMRTATRLVQVAAAQRIRLGLTGLAAIFLLVLIAAAGLRPTQSAAATDSSAEPLAVLGVAPGAGPATFARNSPARPVAPRATRT
jgi:hypothetical protein